MTDNSLVFNASKSDAVLISPFLRKTNPQITLKFGKETIHSIFRNS